MCQAWWWPENLTRDDGPRLGGGESMMSVNVSYAASQAHRIVNVALHQEYSPGIVFIFSQGINDLYHV
jgi:hypothetical protein